MNLTMPLATAGRTTRLTALVSEAEAALIAKHAAAAGQSVSSYLRGRAVGASAEAEADESAALRQVDALVARMEADLEQATVALSAALARMDAA